MLKLNYSLFIFALCSLLGVCVGQIVQDGQCDPNIQLVQNFEIDNFLGTWYEHQRTYSPEQNADCGSFDISSNNDIISVFYKGVNNNFQEDSSGTATLAAGTAQLTLNIDLFDGPKDFWVLLTDYSNYAVTFSCENISPTQRSVYVWVLGRSQTELSDLMLTFISLNINNLLGISTTSLRNIYHNDAVCYVLPVIEPGESVILPGQCDENIPVQQNFDVNAFTGLWHEIASYYTENSIGSCIRAEYTLNDGVVNVLNSQVIDQALLTITGTAEVTSTDNSARLRVMLNITPGQVVERDLWIISTDYNNYAISYTCENISSEEKRIYSWILSRARQLSQSAQADVDQVIQSVLELNNQYFMETDQSAAGCFYFPEPSDQPVQFRGQCDLTIPAMPNFEPDRYVGKWHNIELYPQPFQDGTCGNAFYELNNGVVDVFNTQVIDQTLDTIEGTAVLASDDGSAKLLVTFPIVGTDATITTNYWVLDTDYTSYALVYSCSNINDDYMQVGSWKLSRTKQLTAAANTAINNIMSTIPVLDQRYFRIDDQSEEGCFYFPTPQPGVPVVFPGQCDATIGLQNFELSRFAGTWYEIQAYPKEEQSGQCINHQYTIASNSQLNLVSSNVIDQFLSQTNGVLTSTDTSGRLTITITSSNGQTITIPFWIVDTDYDSYALAYACVNIDTDFRGIWSWKLSRTQQLTPAAVTAIDNAITNIEVLDNRYYENIDQSADACFYLPEIPPGQPIILPGQCDANVQPINSFNTAQFAGRWRLIRSYPTDFLVGTCNTVDYVQVDNNTLSASHEQVVNQYISATTATVTSTDGSGRVQFSIAGSTQTTEYLVLGTDYNSYAVIYGCEDVSATERRVWSWILGRENTLSDSANANINQIINGNQVLNNRYYSAEDRSEAACFYYPDVDPTTAVKFRGTCDLNIPVVQGFDAVAYMGLWHDVESYPDPFQDGTCNNAFYTLIDGVVDVFNTQVINQQLDTIRGTAVLTETDGSAKLEATFNIMGIDVSSKYWVLATDYTSYSFVYSCRPVDDEYVQVTSWKLSRTKTLSAAANTAINNVMNTIPVLDQRYFVQRDQSEAGCFYFPEPQPDTPVVFPGQCDENIATMQNFNFNEFAGTWYEIEAYPKEEESGQCISHEYSFISNTQLNLVSSSVTDQIRTQTNSVVTGTDGKLSIAINSNGQIISIPFWIIDTDYNNYALAYACVNQGSDYRGVWSWKLSRTKQLTAASVTAINNAISNIDVVENRYFETIDQSDQACFYLPEIPAGQPVIFPGQCDANIRGVNNFNLNNYQGRWRLIQSYGTDSQIGTCGVARYTLRDALTLDADHSEVSAQVLRRTTGTATLVGNDGTGRLQFTFPTAIQPSEQIVLATDYNSYALVYGCENVGTDQRRVWSWKLSRDTTLSQAANDNINQVINSIDVLNARYYVNIDHSEAGCFYYPDVDPSSAVRFRGTCDLSIPVVQGFDAVSYMGLWHDVESYPDPFQDGTCNNAFYTLIDGVVDVFNTQVINQQLDTIRGTAVLTETDGSAKLEATFNIMGIDVSSKYWVLATDYTSYSFVYSCRPVDDEYVQVTSWKLSRTKTLSAAANTAINNVMNTIPVLDQRYFVQRDQSEAGCFYFPEPQPDTPVVFPGQCDENIATMQNFNFNEFAGTWYEIEAYPKEEESGQCISHEYSFISNTQLNLVSSSVTDQIRTQTNSVVTGTDGKLSIAINSNGQIISIPFWIIDTDYNNYALAYACVNQGSDYRGVWSWKLSRTKQLTAASVTAINNAISNIDVVENRYFETIDQSDQACFYLPEIPAGQPVIFPGQCDANIRGVDNFNLSSYQGRWRLIQSYGTDSQIGTCGVARYTLRDALTLDADHSEVSAQVLRRTTGTATLVGNDGTGRLQFTFPTAIQPSEQIVLATDYNSYALVYGCENVGTDQRRVWSWKLSRDTTLSQAANDNINQVINSIDVLNARYYVNIDHSEAGCFYYPDVDPSSAVRFRGTCDLNIPVVQGFDAVAYMGLWHDVESYPDPFQDGTCNNAFYTLIDGVVDVFNTQVINQQLDTIRGTAVLTETDGSAKLEATFNIMGIDVSSKYWVLATDYTSYSFVYSCRALDDEYVQVTSWKLSRSKTLSAAANTAINNVISTIPVLDQRYFVQRDQSEAGCFYFPEAQPDTPVVFPGQCDNNIATVQNFNFNEFAGTWYEIEAYPKEEESGQCISHEYSFISNTQLNLVSFSISDQIRTQTNSVVTGTDGRLTIAINSNGQTINIPFWVIDTDYNNYALAYACVNQGSDYRGVWSWKLSRTKQLTAASITAINNAVSNIDVVDNRYFEPIDQSDQACFYLPEIPAGQPVIFPGQCDANIRGVDNFNLSSYQGRWRLIQSYGTDSQIGTCGVARYTLRDALTLDADHSEVSAQVLRRTTGTATLVGNDGTGRLQFTFPTAIQPSEQIVLATDYNSYALVYGCENVGTDQRRVWSWKLSRDTTLSQAANDNINQVINSIDVLNARYYVNIDHSEAGCFYYPDVDPSSAVRFRGTCDLNIPVVQGFDAVAYMGLWHDVESYPDPFQDGTCNNAFYTLIDGVVDVFNTQVINQQLDTIRGTAVLTETDGSAKLEATFNIMGIDVSTKYWVLATDYTSYSFVYSCRALDDEYVQVTSWKLSRSKTLSAAANTAIDNVISTIPVLDQRYFVQRDQSEAGCFYFPEPQPDTPVVFPGQCDDNLATVQNFDYSQFAGTWHEIEAYPKEEQSGQCINHEYSFISNTQLNLVSSSITEQIRTLTNGVVTGNNGRLNIAITSNGQTISIPFWIIDTDYNNYALAYACVNQGNDYRGVWSWKLSRTKQLTAASITAINNAISNIDVVDNRYFEPIDQSDQACFYLPEIPAGQPVIFPGQCDANIRGVDNFNLNSYQGRWRLIQSYGTDSQIGTCGVARYTPRDALTLDADHSEVSAQELRRTIGTATLVGNDGTGRLQFTFPSNIQPSEQIILATDYNSYALVYACENLGTEQRRVWSWKLSRDTTLSQAANDNINQVINSIDVLNARYYTNIDHSETGCFYFPEPNNENEVVFRGQCNEDIPVVQNFDAGNYMGLWHDIQSYPTLFQFGTCPNADYTLVGGTVDVVNTQVINQTLDTITGIAQITSTDGSAKLAVTFDVFGVSVTTNYWVLATDYLNYAFVYSCRNIDDEFMSVFSWKMSRTRTLTAQSNTAINQIINNYNIFDERYYVTQDQSDEGCFYFPEPQVGVPVIFPGQCDDSIAAVQSFNAGEFAGVWHETASYPYAETGQCINHQFAVGTTSPLIVDSFSVLNETLYSSNSPVNLASTDGSGRFTVNIVVNGETRTVPFWVLATDYSDYALAYGCVNVDSLHRQIYSWKLSRSKQPTAAGTTAINNAISNIDVLDNRYYENVDQTDEACFYLPVLSPNEPVTFVGQCDQNIPVISNFNASAYLGRWRLIQTYYADFQLGTCNDATYSAADDGSVIVFNTEVVNQQLETITGSAVLATTDGSGKLSVTFPTSPTASEYWILDTDYESYALVYTCENISSDRRRVWSWKLSRTDTLTAAANAAINQVVDSINVLNDRYYNTVDRSDAACFYYPEPDVNTPVVFRGQCDQTIPAFPSFDPTRYVGLWYDVESYPAPFQTGTCSKAEYSLNSDLSVYVENTQVVDQLLETWIGSAVLASDDNSAKLDVTFNVNGIDVTTSYWVLDTDYDTYALVYSCTNIDAETRSVFSWKLSRTPTLTAAANTAINAVINSVQVLDQQYYIPRGHTDEDCFYYPDNNGGDVLLPGQCLDASAVPAVTNFNSNQFVGTWYEISRYPSGIQQGECVSTQFATSGTNGLTIVQTNVNEERQWNSLIQATVANDGRGIISATIDGVPFNDVFVLGTDYNDYALLYGCRNVDTETKQIYSWKLSRTQSGLSTAANTVINDLVSNNIDLWEGYYRSTGQDIDACFYYPVFDQLPASIELPGSCPTDIRGVPNFDAGAYLGRWFETARYPLQDQIGQCSRAEYSLEDRVVVYNTEVNNETLFVQTGFADIASTDGTGQLNVEFVVNGVLLTANYYILATDYVSYSLVYSCANLANGNSRVSSWKLSRTPTLNAQAAAALVPVIINTRGLLEEYYQTTSQSEEDCFYIPSVVNDQAVVFRGQCESVSGVEGFDAQRYLGWWHEIKSYPVDGLRGQCRSSEYTQDGATYRVVDTEVENNEGTVFAGTVSISVDGRLQRTIPGRPVQDIWVLATDYDTYALLYSCENINTEYRAVWSAVHSKSRSLPNAAQTAINPLIANNRVLYDQFYLDVDQDDDTCFHYPILTNDQVIIPGQCDSTISVVSNFDAESFAGTWYHTESYDDVGESSCVGSRYTVDDATGAIDVLNFEVRDGELETVEGSASIVSNDGSARLDLTFPVAGSEDAYTTTSVSILATDYTSYALAYSCVNVNDYQRQVRAWKLSRERTLSGVGTTAINNLIQTRPELHQPYFKQIEHDEECAEPSSALIIKSSIIMLLVCAFLQRLL